MKNNLLSGSCRCRGLNPGPLTHIALVMVIFAELIKWNVIEVQLMVITWHDIALLFYMSLQYICLFRIGIDNMSCTSIGVLFHAFKPLFLRFNFFHNVLICFLYIILIIMWK
jgi:hypothetical protein